MEDGREVIDEAGEENPQNTTSERQETREEMLSRHRKENTQLQNKEIEMKKAAAKGSKAEQKAKKKQVEEEILKQSAKLKEKQAEELAKLGYCGSGNDQEKGSSLENLVKAIAGVSVNSQADQSKGTKPNKSVKRREKRAQQEAAREQRIKDEQSNTVSDRMVEDEKLKEKLTPLGLTINEVKPDGHCLYRAVEDQLSRLSGGGGSSPYTFQQLREMVASYMREHSSDFLPFLLSENMVEGGESESSDAAETFENYCKEVESTAAWGGQLEIGALTHSLRKHILIYSMLFPDVEMGKEYKSDQRNSSIMLSYHRHAFGLGEHYNSVVPLSQQYNREE